jgi:hypothetical protein
LILLGVILKECSIKEVVLSDIKEPFTTQISTKELLHTIKVATKKQGGKFKIIEFTGKAIDKAVKREAKKLGLI